MRKNIGRVVVAAFLAGSGPAWAQSQTQTQVQTPAQSQPEAQAQSRNPSHSVAKIREYCAEWNETDFSKVKDPFLAGYCLGLVQAFRDGVALGTASTLAFIKEDAAKGLSGKRASYNRWCHPTGVPNQFLVGAFMDWSSRHPKHQLLPYSIGFYEAFREEWPCEDANVQLDTQPPAEAAPKDNRK